MSILEHGYLNQKRTLTIPGVSTYFTSSRAAVKGLAGETTAMRQLHALALYESLRNMVGGVYLIDNGKWR